MSRARVVNQREVIFEKVYSQHDRFYGFPCLLQIKSDWIQIILFQKIGIMKKTLVFLLLLALIFSKESIQNGQKNIGTCAKFTSDKESCLECVPHYHLFEGQCYIDIHGCSLYVFGNICRNCQPGFILVNNECCDKHCMSRIFKNYEAATEQSELTEEQKIERRITEGYEKTAESLSIFRYQFVKFVLLSTSNQVLQGYVRYFIKILANDKPYRCIADFEMDTKKVFILQFRLQSEMGSIKQIILSQQDVVSNDEARVAIQYASGKFGLRTYGSSLERVSATSYKYGSEFKLIYIGTESAFIINVVVASGGSKKQTPYSPWSEERKDAQAIRSFVQKSMSVVKMRNVPELEAIKQRVSESSSIKVAEVEMKTIEKVKENVYKYTFVNDQTKQVFEQTARVEPKTKKVEIIEHKEVISTDVKNMKLPESPEKKIIPKDQVTENPQVKETIKYLEEVQPSLATKEIVNAAVETIGENKKVTLIQKKNDQTSRVVVIHNERTNEKKLVDESPVVSTPPTQTVYTTSPEGKPKIITTDVEKFKKNDEQVDKVITTIEKKLPTINTTNIVSFEKTEGNLVNTYQVVVKGQKPEQPKQQVTVVQNTQTKQVKVIDVEEIPTPTIVEPIKRKPTTLPETEYKTPEVKSIIQEFKKLNTQFKDSEVVVKKVDVEEAKFANQYTVTVVTTKGETLTVKANKPHEQKQPEITSVKPVYQKPTEQKPENIPYISKVTVDEVTGVKTTTTTKPQDIQTSFVKQVLTEVTSTKTQPKVEQIQSVVRKEYEKTVTETVVIKEDKKFVQVTVEQNKQTGTVKKVSEEFVDIKPVESQPVLPVISTTKVSETTFNQVVKLNPVLKTVTQTVTESKPVYKDQAPVTTEVEQRGPVQVVTMVYENKKTQQKQRIVTEFNTDTQKTVIKEQTPLPKEIEKVVFEKDITPQGEIKLISNKIDELKKEDKHITTVIQEVSQKIPIVKDNPVRFEVVSNDISNTYQITAVEPKTKETVTVSVSFNKQTSKVTVNDVQEQPKPETVVSKPIPKPVVVLKPEELTKPEVKNVVTFVGKSVDVQEVKNVKEIKSTLTTTYEVVTKTPEGTKTVTVVVDNSNPKDVTLIDVVSETPVKPTPTEPQTSSYSTISVDSANVKDTTTNDKTTVSSNKYLKLVSQEAIPRQPLLRDQVITCFSEDVYKNTVQITYLATVSSTTVLVSGFVWVDSGKVEILQVPEGTDKLVSSPYRSCAERSSTITTLTSETVTTLTQSDSEISSLVSYITSTFEYKPETIEKVIVEKFVSSVKYVILVTVKRTTQRIVLIYSRKTTQFTVVERPESIEKTKPVVLDQKVDTDGSKITVSNSVEQIKTVDQKVEKFIKVLSQQVPVEPSQITSVVSKQGTNTNEYTITVKTEKTTNEIKAVFKKDDDSVIVTQVKEEPQPLIAPLIRPKLPVPKEEYTSPKITKVVEVINKDQKLPDIAPENIVEIVKTTSPVTTNYEIVTKTPEGNQKFVVSENPKGEVTVIDYKPVDQPKLIAQPVKTEYTVNPVSGYETLVTNDANIIRDTVPIQNVVTKLIQQNKVTKTSEVVSAVTKTLDNRVQTTVVIRSPEKPRENKVVVAVVDKNKNEVTVINDKTVEVVDETEPVTVEEEIIETVYTTTVIQKTIKEDRTLQKIVNKVSEVNQDLKNTTPNQVVMEKIGDKVLSTVAYEGKKVTTLVYDEKTDEVKVISTQPVPKDIKPLVYETERTPEGTTTIMTNSVDKVTEVNRNFEKVISEIKQTNPSIQTEKIEGIKIVKSDFPNAPQKIIVLFQSQKETEKTQIVVIDEPSKGKPVIVDVQTILQEEIIPTPEPVHPTKLTTKEIREQKIESVITSNIKELPFKEVRKVLDVQEVKTPYTTTLDVRVENTDGEKYIIKTQQFENEEPKIVDYVKVTDTKKPEIFTFTSTNVKNGIVSTYTNDVKVMSDEKTFSKCVDALEKQRNLSKRGYVVDSQTISRLQRSVEHHIRFINRDTKEGIDFRVIVDSRTGVISINEETSFTLGSNEPSTVPQEKSFMEIRKSEFAAAEERHEYIKNGRSVLAKADYTFEGKIPDLTQVKQYKSIEGKQSNVEVIFLYNDVVNGNTKRTRVVLLGEEKQTGKGYIMKIIDITTLPDVIQSTETKIVYDEYNRKTTSTNDVKTLEKNNQEYVKVIDQVREEVPSLNSAEVNFVVIRELKNVNEVTMMIKKGTEVIETKAVYDKVNDVTIISDFKTQPKKMQVEKVPIRQIQSIVTEITPEKLSTPEYVTLQEQIKSQPILGPNVEIKSVKMEQNPKVDSYVIKVVGPNQVESTVTAFKNPTTKEITVISVLPDQPKQPEPVRTKETTTEVKVDSVTGSQILTTNDAKVIKESPVIQNVVKKVIQDQTVPQTSEVVSAVTKTSETKIQSTIVVQEPKKPNIQTVIVAIADKKQPTKVQIVTEQTVDTTEEETTVEDIVEEVVREVVITRNVYQTVIKKDTHLQKIVKAVENKYKEVQDVTPVRVTMQEVGDKTISEVTYETKKVTVISNDREQVIKTYDEPIPQVINPGTVETTITRDGVKTTVATNPTIMEQVEPQFTQVLPQIVSQVEKSTIKTVVSSDTSFGTVYTVVSQKPDDTEPKQTTYYYKKETKQVVNMGSEPIPVTTTVLQTPQVSEPVKQVPETKWTTGQVSTVITEVTKVVKQDKVTKVEEVTPQAPTVKFYQVTVDTPQGPEVIKVTVDKTTKEVSVIDQTPVNPSPKPAEPSGPSETTVVVDQTTGVKTTTSTDSNTIRNDKYTKTVHETIIREIPEVQNSEIVSLTTKEYEQKVEERVVYKTEQKPIQVITLVDKKTEEVTVVDKTTVDPTQPTTPEVTITQTILQEVYDRNDILRAAIQFVGTQLPQFKSSKPSTVNFEEFSTVIKFTLVYQPDNSDQPSGTTYRVIVLYTKTTKTFELVESSSPIETVKPLVFETVNTDQGRTNYFTNDIQTLLKYDTNFDDMLAQLTKDLKLDTDTVSSIQSTKTSTGTSYTILTSTGTEQNQVNVLYNENTKTVKITDISTVEPTVIESTVRPSTTLPKEEYTSDDITLIIEKSIEELKIERYTVSQITKIQQTKTTFGTVYTLDIETPNGKAVLTASITTDRKVTIISYRPPVTQQTQPTTVTEAPSVTQFTVDTVTGTQIESTNDVKVIKESPIVKTVVTELIRTSTIPADSEVVSTITKTTTESVQSTLVVKSTTENKVVVTVTDRKTNDVKLIAEKPIPQDQVQEPEITKLVPQTVISSTIYEQVVKKDTVLQNVVKEVRDNHPEIKDPVPIKVVVEKVGDKTVTEVSYPQNTYTVVTDTKTGKTEQVSTSPLPKVEDRKPVILEQRVTEEGIKIVTSNKIETIEKVVPTVRPAITEVTKVISFKPEQIKTISTSVEEKQYTVITVDQTNKVKQIKFTYEPEKPTPIRLIDVQQFSEPATPTKPKEIIFEPVPVEEKPEIVKTIEKLNTTNTLIKNDVTEIVKVEKAVTNFVEQYRVEVKTKNQKNVEELATIILDTSTKQPSVVDVIRYEPQKEQPKAIVVEEKIDSVTQTRQTVFPTVETFKQDETYPKVTEYLQTELTKGYTIVSVVKQNYGENKEISVLLKSQDKSPQQIQLNINSFNNEITVLQNKTIVSHETEQSSLLEKEQPKPVELKLNPVDQQKFEIISKLNIVKTDDDFKTLPEIKTLEKNDLFKKADTYLKTQFESILQQSNIVHVSTKQTLDSEQYKVYYVNTKNNDKELYEAKVELNPITQTFDIKDFTKIAANKPEKSNLNVGADIAYGYEPLENFSNDKNLQFVVDQAKKHYKTLENAVIQSVEVLGLCNGRFNYKIFFKNGLVVEKYIIYYEQAFQRVIFLAGKEFSFGGSTYETLSKDDLVSEGYFKNVNQYLKEKNTEIAEGSEIVHVEREDRGTIYSYRVIYAKDGKTYHASSTIDKDLLNVNIDYFNQVIELPVSTEATTVTPTEQFTVLKINDLAHNSNFEKVHREILSKEGGFLQNAQLVGALQSSQMFSIKYQFFFVMNKQNFKIEAEIDSTTKKVTITSELEKANLDTGYAVENSNSGQASDIIAWVQKSNPDLKAGVIVEVSSKKEIFGRIYKVVFKLQTKYYKVVVYKEGTELKILNQSESTTLEDSTPSVRSFPRPDRSKEVILNKQ